MREIFQELVSQPDFVALQDRVYTVSGKKDPLGYCEDN